MVIPSGLRLLAFVVASTISAPSFADDAKPYTPNDDTPVMVERSNARLGAYGTGGMALFGRETGTNTGYSIGGELAYAFHGAHGIRFEYAYGIGVFGPEVNAFDLDYSYQWNTRPHLDGVTLSFGLLLGPAFGIVNYDGNAPNIHATFGGRAGAFLDLNFWMVTAGLDASYRIGLASAYGAESWGTIGLHLGVTFELPRGRNRHGT